MAGPWAARQASMTMASCVVQSQTAANGMKNWFFCVSRKCKSRARRRISVEAGWPLRFERLAKPSEQGRFERLALQAIEQVGQENKVMRALVDGREHAADTAGQRQGEGTLESQHADQGKRSRLEKRPADRPRPSPARPTERRRFASRCSKRRAGLFPTARGPRDRCPSVRRSRAARDPP